MRKSLSVIQKLHQSRRLVISLLVIIVLISIYFLIPWKKVSQNAPVKSPSLYAQAKIFNSKWNVQINEFGPQKAYDNFKAETITKTLGQQHAYGHLFGELLYDRNGVENLRYCDETFQYACFHGLMGKMIKVEGTNVVPELVNKCKELNQTEAKIFRCQHAIGHGILAYFGYSIDNVKSALDVCNSMTNNIRLDICSGGIYMEYTFRPMQKEEGRTREIENDELLSPCNQLSDTYRPNCYYEQTAWWLDVLPGTDEQKTEKIVQICSQLSAKEQTTCARGFGNYLAIYLEDKYLQTIPLCNKFNDKEKISVCIRQAAYTLANNYDLKAWANDLCATLTGADLDRCHQMYK